MGLTATRAFRGEGKAEGALLDALDRNARSWFWWLFSKRYLGFYPRCDMCHIFSLLTRCDHTAEESSSTTNPRVGFIVCGAISGHVPVDGAAARFS